MTVIGDTSGILASLDRAHAVHQDCVDVICEAPAVVLSPLVLAEIDYMVAKRFGYKAAVAFLGQVERGVYEVAEVGGDEIATAKALLEEYPNLSLGLTDAVNVVLAHALGTDRILTLDQRHFRVVRPMTGGFPAFRLSPFDC